MAAGLGSRLRPLTDAVPKCLVPIAGRPLLDYWLDALERAGIREVLINTHHLPDLVRRYISAVNAGGRVTMSEAFEPTLLGSAGTVHANRAFAPPGTEVLIVYSDNLSTVDLESLVREHRASRAPLTMLLFRSPFPEKCGIATLDDQGRIVSFEEKPRTPRSNLANAGVYVLTAAAYREIADMNVFDFGYDALPRFVGRMRGFIHEGYHRDIGTLESLAQAERDAPRLFPHLVGSSHP